MQTFLPYKDYKKIAVCLDSKRLGKQRVECFQIMLALTKERYGWQNHPIVKMWRGYETSLLRYSVAMCLEWKSRGFLDTCQDKISNLHLAFLQKQLRLKIDMELGDPIWLLDTKLHDSHRSNLLRKMPDWYIQFGWKVEPDLPYYWCEEYRLDDIKIP